MKKQQQRQLVNQQPGKNNVANFITIGKSNEGERKHPTCVWWERNLQFDESDGEKWSRTIRWSFVCQRPT